MLRCFGIGMECRACFICLWPYRSCPCAPGTAKLPGESELHMLVHYRLLLLAADVLVVAPAQTGQCPDTAYELLQSLPGNNISGTLPPQYSTLSAVKVGALMGR